MTNPIDTPASEHHRHAAPARTGSSPKRGLLIALVIVLGLVILGGGVWLFLREAPTPAPTPSPTASSSSSPGPTASPTTPPTAGACTTDNSTAVLANPDASAGSTSVQIIFTNTGTQACTLEGFPTVAFVGDGNGTQIGATASHDTTTSPVALVTIEPTNSAMAVLTITDAGNVESCNPTDADGFRVIPPGSNDSFFLATTDYQACDNTSVEILTISAVATN